jgi:hypothetical protein
MNIQFAQTATEIKKCWYVFSLLRPHLQEETFVEKVAEMFSEGYQIAYIEEERWRSSFSNWLSVFANAF